MRGSNSISVLQITNGSSERVTSQQQTTQVTGFITELEPGYLTKKSMFSNPGDLTRQKVECGRTD